MTTSAARTPDGVATDHVRQRRTRCHRSRGSEEPSSRREAVLATALIGLVAAVVLFGLSLPELLAAAVAIAVLAVIVALDSFLPSGELRRDPGSRWTF